MSRSFLAPALIEQKALDYLKKFNLQDSIPVPIEDIIEIHLKIDIVPTPGLMSEIGVDAVTSHDLSQTLELPR